MKAAHWFIGVAFVVCGCFSNAVAQETFRWEQSLDAAKQLAAQTNRLVLIHFGAPWCAPCQALQRDVFSKPGFGEALKASFVAVKLNADHFPATARQYGVETLPTDVVITPQGQLIYKLNSPPTADQYVASISRVAAANNSRYASVERAALDHRQVAMQQPQPQPPSPVAGPIAPNYTPPAQAIPSDDRYADYFNHRRQGQTATVAAPYRGQPPVGGGSRVSAPWPTDPFSTNTATVPQPGSQPPRIGSSSYSRQTTIPFENAGPPPAESRAETNNVARRPELPPGSPPLGLDGYCPVTLSEQMVWQSGDIRWGVVHRGRTYLFVSPRTQQQFLAKPDAYSPAISGNDPVLAADHGQAVPGRREHGWFYGGAVYLFSSEDTLERFSKDPEGYAARVQALMR